MNKKNNTLKLIYSAMFIALSVVFTRFFSIKLPNLRIGFGFLPLAVCGMYMGPFDTAIVAGVADLIGSYLFPQGPFFPGFVLSALTTGFLYGYFLKKDTVKSKDVILTIVLITIIVRMGMNNLWLTMMGVNSFKALVAVRIIPQIITALVQIPVILLTYRYLVSRIKLNID
ncbi:MAG: folate family ECF transporter S component [Clostridium sp.]|nr:folate family ECF transporter S component [Clostridium sp.]